MENTVLEKFHQGRQSLGTFSAIGSPLAVESLRYTGLDYVIVDTEHSPAGIESAAAQIAAAHGGRAVFGQNSPCGAKTTVWLPLG